MKILESNKLKELEEINLESLFNKYEEINLDIGTGDGRFIYKEALKHPNIFYIGIDPIEKQMSSYLRKVNRSNIKNCLFIIGSIESIPEELNNIINKIYINLPWGSLLEKVANPSIETLNKLSNLLKNGKGNLEVTFGYDSSSEPKQTQRLKLPEINEDYFNTEIKPKYESYGFKLMSINTNKSETLQSLDTSWSKKLIFGNKRPILKVIFQK